MTTYATFPSSLARAPADRFDPAGKHVFCIGIGGCGMSGLARMFAARGALVRGSDREPSETIDLLERDGFSVDMDQSSGWLPERCDLVIATAAVQPSHPQMLAALARNIPTLLYAQALGMCMEGWTGVAIAGTHGKSTTTAMLGIALTDAGLDPTVIVGAMSRQLARGARFEPTLTPTGFRLGAPRVPEGRSRGEPGLLLAEACEYNRSFHNFRPRIASISSVEADHLDVYGTFDKVVESFHEFAKLLPPAGEGGKLLIAHENAHRTTVASGLDCEIATIGFAPDADRVIVFDPETRAVEVRHDREVIAAWVNRLPGAHMAFNAAVALVLAVWCGADPSRVAESLGAFRGIDRRMQFLGERPVAGGVVRVYDDYGHHPTEIECTLRALRDAERPQDHGGRLVCVFQPHQHSRTRHLMEEFATSFGKADLVIVPPIYFVRDSEEEKQLVTAADLVERLRDKGADAVHLPSFEAIIQHLRGACRAGDLLVVMGAGPVWQVGAGYLRSRGA